LGTTIGYLYYNDGYSPLLEIQSLNNSKIFRCII
jgi:hypothetical protein